MANVTYLLGAGASGNCMPTYKNFKERFEAFIYFLNSSVRNLSGQEKNITEGILRISSKIIEEFSYHNTPDTIAKKYYHTTNRDNNDLNNLKNVIILFFIFEQCYDVTKSARRNDSYYTDKLMVEKRYDSFIAALLEPIYSKLKFRDNFKIITWNYDLQFEIVFNAYLQQDFLKCQEFLQSIPSLNEFNIQFSEKQFSIIHLNGIAFSRKDLSLPGPRIPYGNFWNDDQELLKEIIEHYKSMLHATPEHELGGHKLLSFAWERNPSFPHLDPRNKNILELAKKSAAFTEILVVIGYSFPIFNRDIDKELIGNMHHLKKVYIQSPDAENIKESFLGNFKKVNKSISDSETVIIKNLDYFHIPSEWDGIIRRVSPTLAFR